MLHEVSKARCLEVHVLDIQAFLFTNVYRCKNRAKASIHYYHLYQRNGLCPLGGVAKFCDPI